MTPTEVRIVRILRAAPSRVYRAWLDPELMQRWFAPAEYDTSHAEVDERVGGRHESVLTIDLEPTADGGTRLTVVHSRLDSLGAAMPEVADGVNRGLAGGTRQARRHDRSSSMNVTDVMSKPIARQLVRDEPLLRFSDTARDGSPRVVPLAYLWDGNAFRFWTIPFSAKVKALEADPRVALVIDVAGMPPRILLARGRAGLETVDGVPDGYLQASHRTMPAEMWDGFDQQVLATYTSMTAISVVPDWAKLIDFETNAPSAVEEAQRRAQG